MTETVARHPHPEASQDGVREVGVSWLKVLLGSTSGGPKRAGIAVAHSILVIAYHMLRNGVDFNDLRADYFDRMNTAKLTRVMSSKGLP